jgi:hypothetical protein
MSKEAQENETLEKSIDSLIDELFVEEDVEKSIDIAGDANTLADPVMNSAPKNPNDDSRGAGRSREIHDVPETDEDGQKSKEYDAAISNDASEEDQPEISQVSDMSQVEEKNRMGGAAKAPKMAPFKKSEISEEDWAEFQAFKKSQEEAKAEELKKAKLTEQEDLIKSVVDRTMQAASAKYEGEIADLKKSLSEQETLVKAMANKPVPSKSVTNVEALEKSVDNGGQPKQEAFTKSEMLDAAEELALNKSVPEFDVDHVVELENNGYIYDPQARTAFEKYLQRK